MLEQLSQSLNPKLLMLVLAVVAMLILSTAYGSLFKAPLKQYREEQAKYQSLLQRPSNQQTNTGMLAKIRQEITDIDNLLAKKTEREALKGTRPSAVMADLANYAKQHNVQMLRITPAEPVSGNVYKETPFKVDLTGDYKQLYKWVYTLEHSDTPLLIKEFSMLPGGVDNNRLMSLKLGLIQLKEEG